MFPSFRRLPFTPKALWATSRLTILGALAILAAPAIFAPPAFARTKLVALPERAKLTLSLQHPAANLATEQRLLALQKGSNSVDFSWQGVAIDPESIQIAVLDHPGEADQSTKVLNVSYPPNENALTWELFTPEARTETVRISYLLQGFQREDSYRFTVAADEKTAALKEYFRLGNLSGEDLENAAVTRGFGAEWSKGLRNREVKELLSFENSQMPVMKQYLCAPEPFSNKGDEGETIQLVYEIRNEKAAGFGDFKLPAGKARIFQKDPSGDTIFVGEDVLEETAVLEKHHLSLGVVKDVTLKRRIMSDERINVVQNTSHQVSLFDRKVHVRYEMQNFKNEAVTVKVVELLSDDWDIQELDTGGVRHELKDNEHLEIFIDLPARPADEKAEVPKKEVNFIYVMKNQLPNGEIR